MTGVISGIKRMEIHDGDGLRTTVFFKGCPLKCLWCHNPESISFEPQVALFAEKCIGCGRCAGERNEKTAAACPANAQIRYGQAYDVDALLELLLRDKPFFDQSGGGVTLSGGECLAQGAFAVALAERLYQRRVSVNVDTCGFVRQETFERIFPFTDVFLYDLKAMDPGVHKKCTGQENGLILSNLAFLSRRGARIEIRYPLVMGYNDGECEKIGRHLEGVPGIRKVKVLQYHAFSASRYEALGMENTLPLTKTTPEDVEMAVQTLKRYGLNAVSGVTGD